MNKLQKQNYEYTGELQPPQKGEQDAEGRFYYPYIPSDDLKEVVNLAIALERPLLLEGEPGCGKTRLANAIVYEFSKRYLSGQKDWWNYYMWNVKSTTRARDGLYTYDAVARLRDAQLAGADPKWLQDENEGLRKRLKSREEYLKLGPLGKALQQRERPAIVLIDEIDKADSDFPNDLLLELELEREIPIPETNGKIPAPLQKPIIIITSNREKPLPDPFLRRCLYFFVDFPGEERLWEIIEKRFGKLTKPKKQLVSEAVDRFYEIRDLLSDRPGSRPPGTSEFLEFLMALLKRPSAELAMKDLQNLSKRLPLLSTLLKTRADQLLYQEKYPAYE